MKGIENLRAPFPWFGGKSRVASLVWERFGDVANYVEPFAGSLAVLLGRPTEPRIETVNDKDCYLANFWRALANDPQAVAEHADWPVNEADQSARHLWLVKQADFRERMKTDPEFYDAKIAGWWVWGLCTWIGSGWCQSAFTSDWNQRPHLGDAGRGVHRQLPHLVNAGSGVHRKLPHLFRDRGVNSKRCARQMIYDYFDALAARLRRVRVCCGDWKRVCGPTPTFKHGLTGVLLDPPYSAEADRSDALYATDDLQVAHEVRRWAIENESNPLLRIALCGYEGEHEMPGSWDCVQWKSKGGYGSQGDGRGRENSGRERIWFSKHCIAERELPLFVA